MTSDYWHSITVNVEIYAWGLFSCFSLLCVYRENYSHTKITFSIYCYGNCNGIARLTPTCNVCLTFFTKFSPSENSHVYSTWFVYTCTWIKSPAVEYDNLLKLWYFSARLHISLNFIFVEVQIYLMMPIFYARISSFQTQNGFASEKPSHDALEQQRAMEAYKVCLSRILQTPFDRQCRTSYQQW